MSDLNTVIMRNDNLFIYKCGTRPQEWAHTSRDLRHRDEVRCLSQGRPVPVRETSGTRRQERAHTSMNLHRRDTMKLRQEELFMSRNSRSGEARSWRREVVRSGARAILNNMAQSTMVIYPSELKERHCQQLPVSWEVERWVELSWSFGRPQVGTVVSVIPKKRWKRWFAL